MRQLLTSLGFTASAPAAPPPALAGDDDRIEAVRQTMLRALGADVPRECAALPLRIRYAVDAQRLWYLRAELMQALARVHGEAHAAQQLARVTEMFHDLLPRGLASSLAARAAGH